MEVAIFLCVLLVSIAIGIPIASATVETRELMASLVIGNLKAFREGTPYLTALTL